MFTTTFFASAALAITVVSALKTKDLFQSIGDVVPTQCILEGKDG